MRAMPDRSLIKILLIDDDADDALLFRHAVKKIPDGNFVVEWVDDFQTGRTKIAENAHDVYVIDYQLGAENGTQLLREFDVVQREQPFIMLTGAADGTREKEAMKLGAADYLIKGAFDEQLLSRVIRYSIQRKILEAQRIEHLIEVNRSKDEFIAVASHELRTPATAVKQYIGMVTDGFAGDISESQRNFLQRAYESNERQLRIIDDILRVARLDLDTLSLNLVKLDVGQALRGIVKDLADVTKERDQKIKLELAKSPAYISADELYLRMALANIIENASKYSEAGDIDVSVRKIDDMVTIAVRDNGVGIDEKDIEKLFVKFSRIHNPLSIQRGGTGLGLYWTREMISLHQGRIDVESALGMGSTFTVTLPSYKASHDNL